MKLSRLRERYARLSWERKIAVNAALLSLLPVLVALFWLRPETHAESGVAESAGDSRDVDTFIPKGFVLVPIEVRNYEALDSILGRFAMVDLMQAPGAEGAPPRLVARNVRLLRSPRNPSHFAVLVEEPRVAGLLKFGAEFTVIVKARGRGGTEFVKEPSRRKILYEGE